ncbi:MAG: agmatinase [Lentisphaerae bacterium]|nr:agmatinase [Lentisphaerota bacterium]
MKTMFLDLDPSLPEGAPDSASVVVQPIPYDGTASWGKGASEGPAAIIEASCQVEFYDELLRREPREAGIWTAPAPAVPADPSAAVETARAATASIVESGRLPVILGGEHSLSYGVYLALAARWPDIGVVQFDAHADLREEYSGTRFSHASVMARIREHTDRVVQLGIRSLSGEEAAEIAANRWQVGFMHEIRSGGFDLERALSGLPEHVFVTFDVDALDLSLVRSTGTPEPGGFTWTEVTGMLSRIFGMRKVVGFDLMELCGGDPASAFCAARLTHRMIGWATPNGRRK